MHVKLDCGCFVDDAVYSTIHESDGRHYPIGTNPKTYCYRCDRFKPCACTAIGTGVVEGQPYIR